MIRCEHCGSTRTEADTVRDVVTCEAFFGLVCKDCGRVARGHIDRALLRALPVGTVAVTAWGAHLRKFDQGWALVEGGRAASRPFPSAEVAREFVIQGPVQ